MDWGESKQEAEPCPSCGHFYTMTIESRVLVDEANDALKAVYKQLMKDCNILPIAQEKERKKPAKKKTKIQTIAYYCYIINCTL